MTGKFCLFELYFGIDAPFPLGQGAVFMYFLFWESVMKTGFSGYNPISGLLFYVFAFTVSLTATHPVTLITTAVCALIYDIKLRGKKAVKPLMKLVLPMALISALINGFFNHSGETVLFSLPWKSPFTLEAVIYGLVFAVRAGSVLIWLGSFNEILTDDKIMFLFGKISPKTALILSMALRFMPLIMSQSEDIAKAEKGIGISLTSGSFIKRLKCASRRLSVLVSWSLERGIDTKNSMTARGYGLKGRTSYSRYRFGIRDAVFSVLIISGAVLMLISKETLTALFMPGIVIPFPSPFDIFTSVYLAFILLLPAIIDIREERKWSLSA